MPKKRKKEEILTLAVARLRAEGKLQTEVAEQLDINQAKVSRLLKDAVKNGWLEIVPPQLVKSAVPVDIWDKVDEEYFSYPELKERLNKWSPEKIQCNVSVIHADARQFARSAAKPVLDLISKARKVGVMWGRTICEVAEGIDALHPQSSFSGDPVRFIPLCGEPLHLKTPRNTDFSSSRLAAYLERLINGAEGEPPLLSGVPAYIPLSLKGAKAKAIREFIDLIPGYQIVFGGQYTRSKDEPLVEKIDSILTGIGISGGYATDDESYTGSFLRERLAQGDITKDELHSSVFGDIGGVIIAHSNLPSDMKNRIRDMNERWTGIDRGHLQRCAERANKKSRPGVIVVASGKAKAEMVREVVSRGLVNELIINRSLADGLMELSSSN